MGPLYRKDASSDQSEIPKGKRVLNLRRSYPITGLDRSLRDPGVRDYHNL